ncbi:hypothetical protein PIB30_056750 [Stylosanthes scabra]|uniref:Uncharacterized protein n=1 Tax=Stylosanthes scabra TaxID=79078 RepID=A0ABU6RJJ0_9FABA|nr:hypothetical protein [Stylosanthes scabra]
MFQTPSARDKGLSELQRTKVPAPSERVTFLVPLPGKRNICLFLIDYRPSKSLPNLRGCIPTLSRCKGRKGTLLEQIANQVDTLCSIVIQWKTQSAINNYSSTSQPLNSEDRPSKSLPNLRGCIPTLSRCKGRKGTLSQPRSNKWRSIPTLYIHQERKKDSLLSQPLSNQWRSIPTLFRCANQKEREDALLYEENVESLEQERMHECLEEVEEENKCQEVEDIDQEVENKDKEQGGVEIVHFASSEATPPKLPSELHFKWVNSYDMNCLGPQLYGLIETDGQLKALCGVLDKKKMESMELNESKFKGCNGLLHKLHNNKAKIGWANRVWDPGKKLHGSSLGGHSLHGSS